MRAKLFLLVLAALAAGAGATWLAANAQAGRPTEPGPYLTLLVGVSLIGSGLASWRARPDNRLGPVMIVTGFAWFAGLMSEATDGAVYTAGLAVQYLFVAGFVYIILTFPSGRLRGRLDQWIMSVAVVALGLQVAAMLFGSGSGLRCGGNCGHNLIQLFHANGLALALLSIERIAAVALTLTAVGLVVFRWLRASRPERREVTWVVLAGTATLVALLATVVDDLLGNPLRSGPATVWFFTLALVPIAIVATFVRRTLARGSVAGLVVQLGGPTEPADLRAALSTALGDPSLELAYWFPAEARYVTGDGRPVDVPGADSARRSTFVQRDGTPIAMLLHDPALEHNSALVQSVCAAAGLALENERLGAELRARLVELNASRGRLVEATDAERRRIERNLHDGTQQRLVSIAMSLGLLESKLTPDQSDAAPIVHEARTALTLALEELRELTQGIHPTLLVERGLPVALEELCRRAGLPAHLRIDLDTRLPDQVETAAYYFASEAVSNAVKHSHGNEIRVDVSYDGRTLTVDILDDGIGGAAVGGRAGSGSGLRGLADRVEALGGQFTVSSPPGRGTRLVARIPCA
ncbi:MAG TPA: histidine kinase [Solirubrobacteraceae bacterium]|jgi:signal transduction histidine kinase|nr:histidine kinase [Solirubrobacteraceae bacterium]